jgi:DnaJ-class molecular chaperone
MANRNTNTNKNTIENKNVVKVIVKTGSFQRGSKTKRCASCKGTGFSDGPVQQNYCPICRGKGSVPV